MKGENRASDVDSRPELGFAADKAVDFAAVEGMTTVSHRHRSFGRQGALDSSIARHQRVVAGGEPGATRQAFRSRSSGSDSTSSSGKSSSSGEPQPAPAANSLVDYLDANGITGVTERNKYSLAADGRTILYEGNPL